MKKEILISPSVICADMCNLEKDIRELEKNNIKMLHIDFIDGEFSPSMPLGFSTIQEARKLTEIKFDVHLMTVNNELFIQEALNAGADSICFHYESAFHVQRMIQLIKDAGREVGIALNPATPINVLDCVVSSCNYVLLMLISPGYAGNKNEGMVPYALEKIRDCRAYLDEKNPDAKIIVDGRVAPDIIPEIIEAGAEILVSGSTGVFRKGYTMEENCRALDEAVKKGLHRMETERKQK